MNNPNSFNSSMTKANAGNLNKLTTYVDVTCNSLLLGLTMTMENVSSYGTKITKKVMDTEFVDRVINNITLLKRHLGEIKKHAYNLEISEESLATLTTSLLNISDTFTTLMRENSYFKNIFGYSVEEITNKIPHVIEKLPMKNYHAVRAVQ